MAGHFTKKCFYFRIFDCYKLKLSVSKNWQLFSNFNTHQFWSQKQLKTNWAHFFEHKERPQCAIWQSLTWYTWPTAVHAFQTTEQLKYLALGYKVARCCWPLTSRGLEPGTLGFRVQCSDRSTTRPSFFNTRTGNSPWPCKLTPGSLLFSGAGFLTSKHF